MERGFRDREEDEGSKGGLGRPSVLLDRQSLLDSTWTSLCRRFARFFDIHRGGALVGFRQR